MVPDPAHGTDILKPEAETFNLGLRTEDLVAPVNSENC